jgi:hypothetical protein
MGNYLEGIVTSESLDDEKNTMDVSKEPNLNCFEDIYDSLEDVQKALIKSGLESSNLVIGIDYTGSNVKTGEKSFGGKNLHTLNKNIMNPYQSVISIVGRTLSKLDEDNMSDKQIF